MTSVPAVEAEPAAPPTDEHRRPIRSGADLLRLLVALGSLVVIVCVALWAGGDVRSIQGDVVELMSNVPDLVREAMAGSAQLALLVIPLLVIGLLLLRRDVRVVGLVLLAAAITIPFTAAMLWLADDTSSSSIKQVASQESWIRDSGFPGTLYLAALAAGAVVVGPWVSRGWRRTIWALVIVIGILRTISGASTVFELLAAAAIGIAVGSAVLLIFGAPDRGPTRGAVLDALNRAGVGIRRIDETGVGQEGARTYRATTLDDQARVVTVFCDDDRRWDVMFRLYRYLRVRSIADEEVFRSTRSMAEHRAFFALWASNAGAAVPMPRAVVPVGDSSVAVVEDAVDGESLRRIDADRVTDAVLDAVWTQMRQLEAARIAHRDLTGRSVRVTDTPEPAAWLVDFTWGQLAADDAVLGLDLAQLMCEVALVVGVERTVASALRVLLPERLNGALPFLQLAALDDDTRQRLRKLKQKQIPKELRAGIVAATGAEEVKLEKISRITWKQVGIVVLIVVGVYLLLPMVASIPEVWDALQEANWWWIAATLPLVALQYVGATMNFTGAVPGRLPFVQTYLVQLASAFLNRVTPKNVGGMALRLRWLTKRGIDPATAAGSVGLTSLAGTVSTTVLMVVFFVWAGRDQGFSFTMPSTTAILIGVAVVAVLLGAFALSRPGRNLLAKGWGWVRQALDNLGPLFKSPVKVINLFGGNAVSTLAQIVALDFTLEAFGVGLPFSQVGVVYLFSNLVANASPTPGGIGVIEAALIFMLVGYGVPEAEATSAVLVFRAITYWLVTLPGWISLEYLRHRDAV